MCVTIVIVDLSLFGFRVQSRDDLKGVFADENFGDDDVSRKLAYDEKKVFFFYLELLEKVDESCRKEIALADG